MSTPALRKNLEALRELVGRRGWTVADEKEVQSGYQVTVSDGIDRVPVNFYSTGKALVQGKAGALRDDLQAWWQGQGGGGAKAAPTAHAAPAARARTAVPRIGMDESGKGDYFGPLVIAAAYVDERTEEILVTLGVRDSKRLADNRIRGLAEEIMAVCPHSVVPIGPRRYNELYAKFRNLNRLLAWGHARALENVLEKAPASLAIADQFGDESLILNALLEKGRQIRLEQRPRAEEDTAVAAASVLARAEYVRRMEQLSEQAGTRLPKGASDPSIVPIARRIAAGGGEAALAEVAKLHFKTTKEALGDEKATLSPG